SRRRDRGREGHPRARGGSRRRRRAHRGGSAGACRGPLQCRGCAEGRGDVRGGTVCCDLSHGMKITSVALRFGLRELRRDALRAESIVAMTRLAPIVLRLFRPLRRGHGATVAPELQPSQGLDARATPRTAATSASAQNERLRRECYPRYPRNGFTRGTASEGAMVSFEVRRLPKVPAIALLLAAIPAVGFGQLESSADEVLARLTDSIEETRQREGIHGAGLIGPMAALAHYYQDRNDPELAIAALQQARQVVRVNYGLFSLEEAPLLQAWIRAEQERGNPEGAWDVEQRLLNLVRRNLDDVRVVPILREIGDRRLDILERYSRGEFPPEIVLGCYYATRGAGECHAGSRGRAKAAL